MTRAADFEGFAQRLLQLLDEGRFVATYKFAVLLGLLDVLSETAGPAGRALESLPTDDLARAVLDIYWTHTLPFQDAGTLRQNQSGQAEVLRSIGKFRTETVRDATAPLSRARWKEPVAFKCLSREVEWKLIEMPLGRLQRIGSQDEPFIYRLGWDEPPKESVVKAGAFDGRLYLLPGAGDNMLRASALLRPLVQRSWTLTVARFNKMPEAANRERLSRARVSG